MLGEQRNVYRAKAKGTYFEFKEAEFSVSGYNNKSADRYATLGRQVITWCFLFVSYLFDNSQQNTAPCIFLTSMHLITTTLTG